MPIEALKEDTDLEAELESFMATQAATESGAENVMKNPDTVIGGDAVDDETARKYCMQVVQALKTLQEKRGMSVNEVKLIVAIEDPRSRENRSMGIEDDRGVSRDEMGIALTEIVEGRIPNDRIALQCLYEEMLEWPCMFELDVNN